MVEPVPLECRIVDDCTHLVDVRLADPLDMHVDPVSALRRRNGVQAPGALRFPLF